jgi:hypothetical protein
MMPLGRINREHGLLHANRRPQWDPRPPAGFSYKIVTREGATDLSFGQGKTPAFHDGTGVVDASRRSLTIIQNHEMTPHMSAFGVPHIAGTVYDAGAADAGGCTVITTDGNGTRTAEWVGISGTVRNCAGGVTPWGTWLTCEETFINAGATWSAAGQTGTYEKNHGYVFEVFRADSAHQLPKPIKAFGRYEHEALAVEPNLKRVYLSEDASGPNGLFYRWTAPNGVRLRAGLANSLSDTAGKLEAMQIRLDDGSIVPDVAYVTSAQLGRPFKATWTEVPERDAVSKPTRTQFADGTVTRGKKFEGVWSNGKGAYIVNSFAFGASDLPADATKHDGMVWFYDYSDETITLVTYFPHNPAAETEGPYPKYFDLTFDGPRQRHCHPVGHARAGRGRHARLARAQLRARRPDLRDRPEHGQQRHRQRRAHLLRVHRADVLPGRQDPFRQHPGTRHHPGDHRPLAEVPRLAVRHGSTTREAVTYRVTASGVGGAAPAGDYWAARKAGMRPPASTVSICRGDSRCRARIVVSRVVLCTVTSAPARRVVGRSRMTSRSPVAPGSSSYSSGRTPRLTRFCQWIRA